MDPRLGVALGREPVGEATIMARLSIENVSLQFATKRGADVTALDNLSLEIPDKEFAVIVGPSGCGKSSLLYLLAGLHMPSGGRCKIDDNVIDEPGADRGMVFQGYTLFPWLTVQKNVEFGLSLGTMPPAERADIARRYIGEVGLDGFADSYPNQLSGGMRQRVALARALANDPEVLLMDEPFGALDSQTRAIMQELLLKVWEQNHKTVLFVTHDIDEALLLGDKVYVMSARPGRIIETIDVEIARPRNVDVITSQYFVGQKRRVLDLLHDEVLQAMGAPVT
jgi:NitT/TauT family transport system ATP-binding protein